MRFYTVPTPRAAVSRKLYEEWASFTAFTAVSVSTNAKEVKDFTNTCAWWSIKEEESLKRIINYPVRGIGKTTLDKLVLLANQHGVSAWDILCNAGMYGFRSGTLET